MCPRHPTVEFGTLNSDDGAETLDLISSPEGDVSGFNVHQLTISTTGVAGGFDVQVRYSGSDDFVTPTPTTDAAAVARFELAGDDDRQALFLYGLIDAIKVTPDGSVAADLDYTPILNGWME